MDAFVLIWICVQILIGYNLVLPFVFYLIWKLKRREVFNVIHDSQEADYGIIVTAYQQTNLLPAVIQSLLNMNYKNFIIYIVADNCEASPPNFNHEQVVILTPPEVLASNTRSHFYAIDHFIRPHERITIIDSDNLVHPEYLVEMNILFNRGFIAVQGLRAAKNLDSVYACLDAARDIYYHFYDGKVLFELQSSATLSGSGMAFTLDLYKSCLENKDIQGAGFDKVLQFEILERNQRIAFAPNAIVMDEKTSESSQLVNQRSRWINTWFKYFYLGFNLIFKGFKNRSWNQLLFGIVLLRPPLFIFLILSLSFMVIDLFFAPEQALYWLIAFISFVVGFLLSLINSNADQRIYNSLNGIPKFVYYQIKALVYSKNANRRSVATIHKGAKQNPISSKRQ